MKIYVSIPSWKGKKLIGLLKEKAEVVIAKKRPTQEEFEEIIGNLTYFLMPNNFFDWSNRIYEEYPEIKKELRGVEDKQNTRSFSA